MIFKKRKESNFAAKQQFTKKQNNDSSEISSHRNKRIKKITVSTKKTMQKCNRLVEKSKLLLMQ